MFMIWAWTIFSVVIVLLALICWYVVPLLIEGRWYFIQAFIGFLVVASNIYWQWTPNMYLAGSIGAGCAFGFTALWAAIPGWRRARSWRRQVAARSVLAAGGSRDFRYSYPGSPH